MTLFFLFGNLQGKYNIVTKVGVRDLEKLKFKVKTETFCDLEIK